MTCANRTACLPILGLLLLSRPALPVSPDSPSAERLFEEGQRLQAQATTDTLQQAVAKYQEAQRLWREAGESARQLSALNELGLTYASLGETRLALDTLAGALRQARLTRDRKREGVLLNDIGTVYDERGEARSALESLSQALAVKESNRDLHGAAITRHNVALVYLGLGEYEQALQALAEAARVFEKQGDVRGRAAVLMATARVYRAQDRPDEALVAAREALPIWQKLREIDPESRWGEATALDTLGLVQLARGRAEAGLEPLARALAIRRELGSRRSVAVSLNHLGDAYLASGEPQKARALCEEAHALMRVLGDRGAEAAALYCIARADRELGNVREALSAVESALEKVDGLRTTLDSHDLRASYLATAQDYYALAIELLMALDEIELQGAHAASALETAERARARTLLDLLAEAAVADDATLPAAEHALQADIVGRIAALQRQLWRLRSPQPGEASILAALDRAEQELETLRVSIRNADPRYAALHYPEPIRAQDMLRLAGPGTALVEYALGPRRSFAWVVTEEGIAAVSLPARSEIERLAAAYRRALVRPATGLTLRQALEGLQSPGRELYDAIVRPLEPLLAPCQQLIVVPDGALALVPFEALPLAPSASEPDAPSYLIRRFAIAYAPSASVLQAIATREDPSAPAAREALLALGDPVPSRPYVRRSATSRFYAERGFDFTRLPYTRAEIEGIALLFPAGQKDVYLGAQAVEARIKGAELGRYRYLHFASHGYVVEDHPSRSGILLSASSGEDGMLQMGEIMRLRLRADLVTLSACRTGLGKTVRGEGIVGLPRAFLYAGARSVLATLWAVNDLATPELMVDFYRNVKSGLPQREALRRAKMRLIDGEHPLWRHPYYWAPFVLTGGGAGKRPPVDNLGTTPRDVSLLVE